MMYERFLKFTLNLEAHEGGDKFQQLLQLQAYMDTELYSFVRLDTPAAPGHRGETRRSKSAAPEWRRKSSSEQDSSESVDTNNNNHSHLDGRRSTPHAPLLHMT